jgi:hypothetical protein
MPGQEIINSLTVLISQNFDGMGQLVRFGLRFHGKMIPAVIFF